MHFRFIIKRINVFSSNSLAYHCSLLGHRWVVVSELTREKVLAHCPGDVLEKMARVNY